MPQQDFRKITLFTGKFNYFIPRGMTEFGPRLGDNDFKYIKYFLNKDSSLRIEVTLEYKQLNSLQVYQKPEQEALLHRIDGADEIIISNEVQVMQNRKIILVSCEYLLPGEKRDKGIARRIVFNTSAGLASMNLLYSFKTPAEKEQGQLLFKKIIEKLEMH
jgi:hypothetical protein